MPGTQCKLYRRGTEKAGKGRGIKKGKLGKKDILCSLKMMRNINYKAFRLDFNFMVCEMSFERCLVVKNHIWHYGFSHIRRLNCQVTVK